MKLFVGGEGNGKLEFVLEKYALTNDDVALTFEEAKTKKIFYNLQDEVKEALKKEADPYKAMEEVTKINPDIFVICNEVGSGVVPIEKEDRRYREAVGRICCQLAKKSDAVYRIICGLPMVLKGKE